MKRIITTIAIAFSLNANAQNISTCIGNGTAGTGGDGGTALSANMLRPWGIKKDTHGNTFIVDAQANNIRKVSNTGVITTIAGTGAFGFGGDGGPATAAIFAQPGDIAVDAKGNVYVDDEYNHVIRKIDTSGMISTYAGTYVAGGFGGFGGDGGPANMAQLSYPSSIVVDAIGNLYIADQQNNRIRMVDTFGVITTIAGTGANACTGDGGQAINAEIGKPYTLAIDASGNLYVGENFFPVIRMINTSGIISRIAGDPNNGGYSGEGGLATAATINPATGLAVDLRGNIYISSQNDNRVLKVNGMGIITTYVGNGTSGYTGDGGVGNAAQVNGPDGICTDAMNNLYVCDTYNHVIRKIVPLQGAALNFDGNNDYVVVNPAANFDNLSLQKFTLEAWVNPSDILGARSIVRKTGDYNLYINNGVAYAEVWTNGIGDPNFTTYISTSTIATNTWTHVAFTYNKLSGNIAMYVNGVAETVSTVSHFGGALDQLQIGASPNYGNYYIGSMDEVRIWNTERTVCQINAAKNCELSGMQTGLLAYYKFNEGFADDNNTVNIATDSSGLSNNGTLVNFALTGNSSNWIDSGAVASNVSCGLVISAVMVNSPAICMGDTTTLTASGATTYLWSTTEISDSIKVAPTTLASYSVTGTDGNGCSLTGNATVSVNSLPIVTAGATDTVICNGSTTIVNGAGAATYTWTGGVINNTAFAPTGTNTYTVTGTDLNGCKNDTVLSIVVNQAITYSQTLTLCAGESITVGSSVYNASGTFIDTLAAYTTCDSIVTTNLTVNNAIDVTTSTTLVTLTANATGATYQWIDCGNANAPITGETNQSFTATTNGNYAVIVTVNSCSDTSMCVNVNSVGIRSLTQNNMLLVYPNPGKGVYTIEFADNAVVVVTNALGQLILNEQFTKGKQNLTIRDEPNGVYFVKVISEGKQQTVKLIKED